MQVGHVALVQQFDGDAASEQLVNLVVDGDGGVFGDVHGGVG